MIHMSCATEDPTSQRIRARISSAALFVNVIDRIALGRTPDRSRCATRYVMTRVFPEPAPATIRTGPSVARTASRWTGFRSASRSFGGASMTAQYPAGCDVLRRRIHPFTRWAPHFVRRPSSNAGGGALEVRDELGVDLLGVLGVERVARLVPDPGACAG